MLCLAWIAAVDNKLDPYVQLCVITCIYATLKKPFMLPHFCLVFHPWPTQNNLNM